MLRCGLYLFIVTAASVSGLRPAVSRATRATLLRRAVLLLPLGTLQPAAWAEETSEQMRSKWALDVPRGLLQACPDTRIQCISSLDPTHFLEAWEYDQPPADAVAAVLAEIRRIGGTVEKPDDSSRGVAIYATFADGADRSIFWFPCAVSATEPPQSS